MSTTLPFATSDVLRHDPSIRSRNVSPFVPSTMVWYFARRGMG